MKFLVLIFLLKLSFAFAELPCDLHLNGVKTIDDLVVKLLPKDVNKAIEIGPFKLPICKDCIPVDRFRSVAEYRYAIYREKLNPPRPMSYDEWLKANPEIAKKIPDDHNTWVVNRPNGVQADARNLPFDDDSMDLVVMNGFPWKDIKDGALNLNDPAHLPYRMDVLNELKRVVSKKGQVLITGTEAELVHVDELAKELGFKVNKAVMDIKILKRDDVPAYILTK